MVLNKVDKSYEAVFEKMPWYPEGWSGGPPEDHVRPPEAQPAWEPDEEEEQRKQRWYRELAEKFDGIEQHIAEDGTPRVWTDGGCANLGTTRVAGYGVYGDGNAANGAYPVLGRQTAARAELEALMHVVESERRSVEVASDCEYVVKGFNTYRQRYRARAWLARPLAAMPVPHADAWRRIDAAAAQRERRGLRTRVRWVRGHAAPEHCERGETTQLDAHANNAADALATRARRAAAAAVGAAPPR